MISPYSWLFHSFKEWHFCLLKVPWLPKHVWLYAYFRIPLLAVYLLIFIDLLGSGLGYLFWFFYVETCYAGVVIMVVQNGIGASLIVATGPFKGLFVWALSDWCYCLLPLKSTRLAKVLECAEYRYGLVGHDPPSSTIWLFTILLLGNVIAHLQPDLLHNFMFCWLVRLMTMA